MQIFVKVTNLIKNNNLMNTLTFTVNKYDTLNLLLERISERINIQSKYIYLLYPQKNSSPPSPDKATLILSFIDLNSKNVGICDESPNGSS